MFFSYFESDEWAHLTYYYPLTQKADGLFQAVIGTMHHTGTLSQGLHVVPVSWGIFYLDTLLFGMNFVPYAFMALLLHAINSFLIFLLIKIYLNKKNTWKNTVMAFTGGIFFALSPTPIHAWTGATPFYGQNILAVTFFIASILSFKWALITAKKKYLYITIAFLFLALFAKESAALLFLLLPFIVVVEKKVFSPKLLAKLFIIAVLIFTFIRFILPHIPLGYNSTDKVEIAVNTSDVADNSITNTNLSVIKDVPAELLFRTITFPIRAISQLYFPRPTLYSIVETITPIIYPPIKGIEGAEHAQKLQSFVTGPGSDYFIYGFSAGILLLFIYLFNKFKKNKENEKLRIIIVGLAIIIFGTLPLVLIIFSFPQWGYDTYFDSRHYYLPAVGAAILFPFLLLAISNLVTKLIQTVSKIVVPSAFIAVILFLVWLSSSLNDIKVSLYATVDLTGSPRRQIVEQIKQQLPSLPQNVVFYVETDGLGPYGKILPFQTSIPQVLSIIYYNKSHLPDSFYKTTIFDGKAEGYQYADGRGFGYYASKKSLTDALLENKFKVDNIYSFYYDSQQIKVTQKTDEVREELKKYLTEKEKTGEWRKYNDATSAAKITFLYPSQTNITDQPIATDEALIVKSLEITHPDFTAEMKFIKVTPTFDLNEYTEIWKKINNISESTTNTKKVSFDQYRANDVTVISNFNQTIYMMKLNDLLLVTTTEMKDSNILLEKILGSIELQL
jgi:hypothetical protein